MRCVPVRVESVDQVGDARRRAALLATTVGLDETAAGRLALVVTECANNLWKHGGGGEMLLCPIEGESAGVEVLALDKGPGLPDLERCFEDGYSTAGSAGQGLGAINRLSDRCAVYAPAGQGTALLARVSSAARRPAGLPATQCDRVAEPSTQAARPEAACRPAKGSAVGGVSVPKSGETECGDDFAFKEGPGWRTILVVDALGHGPLAAEAADAAVLAFHESESDEPGDLLREISAALRPTRGAAAVVAKMDSARGQLRYAGIGNIAAFTRSNGDTRHLLSHPGIVGHDIRNVRELTYPLDRNVLLLLYSDGIESHWSLDQYAGALSSEPSLIAGLIYRDHSRRRDDATVVVARASQQQ